LSFNISDSISSKFFFLSEKWFDNI
jgi:hypothetical protein